MNTRKLIIETLAILGASLAAALLFNAFSGRGLALFRPYVPTPVGTTAPAAPGAPAAPAVPAVSVPEVDGDFVLQMVQSQGAVIVDARATPLFQEGHIPSAWSLPVKEFASYYPFFAQRVDFDRIVIVYCTGHECTDSLELAALLTQKGYRLVQVYKGGMSEWQERKFDVER